MFGSSPFKDLPAPKNMYCRFFIAIKLFWDRSEVFFCLYPTPTLDPRLKRVKLLRQSILSLVRRFLSFFRLQWMSLFPYFMRTILSYKNNHRRQDKNIKLIVDQANNECIFRLYVPETTSALAYFALFLFEMP